MILKLINMKNIFICLLFFSFVSCRSGDASWIINSPSGNLKTIVTTDGKNVFYSIVTLSNGTETVVLPASPLGLERSDASFYNNLVVDSLTREAEISDSYTMITGKQRQLSYKAHEATLYLSNSSKHKLQIVFRVFNDGVGFRYVFPEKLNNKVSVLAEKTGFNIPVTADGWISPYERSNNYGQPGYELDYLAVKSGTASPDSIGWAFPMLFKNGSQWLYLSETGLDETYCGSHLDNEKNKGVYTIAFPKPNERYGKGAANPTSELPWALPWRYIVVGNSINEIYGSSIGYHLAQPSKLADVSWIKPGRSSWEWWSSTGGRTVKNLNEFIDLAAEMTWEYSLVDGGWGKIPDGKLEDVVSYANKKKVMLTLWYNSGGRRDTTMKDEDYVMFNDDTRDKEMARISAMGFKGIKVDFFASDKQYVIQLYLKILQDAAKYHLLVDFHGCTLPRGWSRTYPNLMSMEAIKGAECYRYSKVYPDMAARFNTVAALVRGMAGPTDYTPVTFTNQKYPHKTTSSHELALAVVYESGIVHLADKPQGYRNLPVEARQFLKQVPSVWDESRLIEAIPGDLLVIARKNAGKWYIAGINGKNEIQEVKIKLPEPLTNPTLIADGEAPAEMAIKKIEGRVSEYRIKMMPGGGFVIYQ
jgi:alpha-glucosidase